MDAYTYTYRHAKSHAHTHKNARTQTSIIIIRVQVYVFTPSNIQEDTAIIYTGNIDIWILVTLHIPIALMAMLLFNIISNRPHIL